MEPMTALALAFQLIALFSIAGALLVYLICKVRGNIQTNTISGSSIIRQPITVFVTSADTALGLQLCTHLANRGCRVFAGMKEINDSLPAKLLCGWLRMRECSDEPVRGSIIAIQVDVTREDMLREAIIGIGAHLNVGERGIAAVINTSGSVYRGRVESQDVQQWEHMLKTNISGSLRVAKAFVGFLRHTKGRLIYLGAGNDSEGLVAFNASRMAVEKCVEELRKELQPYGISVVALDTSGVSADSIYRAPMPQALSDCEGAPVQYSVDVLSAHALQVIERALFDPIPQNRYQLSTSHSKYDFLLPSSCRSSVRMTKFMESASKVQRVLSAKDASAREQKKGKEEQMIGDTPNLLKDEDVIVSFV